MNPFILSRNVFHRYCEEFLNDSSSSMEHQRAIESVNERYEHFLRTLERLQTSVQHVENNSSVKFRQKKKRRMPKVFLTVSCAQHLTEKKPRLIKH